MPAQNPFDITGIAPLGRWAYGPYFWPATNNPYQPIPNPYWDEAGICDPTLDPTPGDGLTPADIAWNEANVPGYTTINGAPFCQMPQIPSTPNPSWGAEAFMDTPVINGTAYPVLNVNPQAYRLRILNAAHDRFQNLSLFVADTLDPNTAIEDDLTTPMDEGTLTTASAALCATYTGLPNPGCATNTEVRMVPAIDYSGTPGWPATWPADVRPGGVPDWTKKGPNWIMIGNEGGFLPQPVVIPAHPVNWNVDVTTFNAGNVNAGSLILAPAERADVIVDFCAFAGQTLILYNDAPAPWPALDPHYDYYTGSPDNTDMGGYTEVIPGFGPNIRTIMQINVASGGCTAYDSTNLFSAFTSSSQQTGVKSVFEIGQDPIIVAQGNINPTGDPAYYEAFPFDTAPYAKPYDAYNKAYDRTFPSVYPNWGLGQINSKTLNFKGFDADGTYNQSSYIYTTATVPHPLDPTINVHGGVPMMFKAIQDEQGETFDDYGRMRAALGIENITPGAGRVNFIVQTYNDPSTEILAPGATQVWKITHNGVDTHPIHFHLFDVQVINRVGWDGFLRLPDPTELGWKETVRISPLEDTIVALRPVQPDLPFGIPTSYRPKNPARPTGNLEMTELTQIEPVTGAIRDNHNEFISLGWEYVWHCHILSHEENDMMRPIIFNVPAVAPEAPVLSATLINPLRIDISWTDPVPVDPAQNEIGFLIERSDNGGAFDANFATALANETTYSDTNVAIGHTYVYRIRAYNAAGNSLYSNTASVTAEQVKKSNWIYATVNNTTGNVLVYWNVSLTPGVTYVLQQATNPSFTGATQVYNDTGSSTTVNVSTSGTYYYRVKATKLGMVDSVWTDSTGYAVALAAARPSFITVPGSSTTGNIALSWTASATPGVTYIVQQATNPSFTGATEVYNNTGTSTTVNVVTNSTYYYRVMATKTNYADSAWRQGVNGCVVNIFVPTAVTPNWIVVPANAPAGSIYVYWGTTSTPNATFVLEESKDLGAWTPVYSAALTPPATNRFVTLTGRTTGSYRYRVKVVAAGYIDSPYRTGTNPTIVP
ncbi:MAG: multicopper oxidase domain-containing protein [Nitrospirae bacterium]|nr:multicopper oxidase domain-containing protein [Nitrospirota bacterium]